MAGGTTWRFLLIPLGYFWQYNLEGSTFDNTITQRIIFVKKSPSIVPRRLAVAAMEQRSRMLASEIYAQK
jgi:hypothetical protein